MSENTSTAETGQGGSATEEEGNLSHEGDAQQPSYTALQFLQDAPSLKSDNSSQTDPDIGPDGESDEETIPENTTEETPVEDEEEISQEEPPRKRTLQEIQQHRQQLKNARKYDGLDEDETKLFKQMSQAAYDRLYPAYLSSKESSKKLKELEDTNKLLENRRWYEEDNAWELSPEFRQVRENLELLDFEENYWTEQLAKIEKGEPYNPLAGKPGEYTEGPEQPATINAKVDVMRKLQTIGGFKQQLSSKAEGIRADFSGRYKSFNEGLKGVHDHLFGKLNVELPHLAPQYKAWLEKFPKEFRGQLPYQMLAKAAVVIEGLSKTLRGYEATSGLKKSSAQATKSVGPGNGKATGGAGNGQNSSLKTWDDTFAKLTGKRVSS